MPFADLKDLATRHPDVKRYSEHGQKTFLAAFNRAYREKGEDAYAFAVAHTAAKYADKTLARPGKIPGQ